MSTIKVVNGALDIIEIDGVERFALRGVIDPPSLSGINVPEYQREILADGKIDVLKKALETGRVPDIDLGMRGSAMTDLGDGVFLLRDDIFVIDGLQRTTAAMRLFEQDVMPHLGAIIHFDTTEVWERKRFEALNLGQTGLNSNVILRNLAHDEPAAKVVYDITQGRQFIIRDKISWQQNMRRTDLITAITFYKVIGRLHSHLGPGKSDPRSLAKTGFPKIFKTVKPAVFEYNVNYFFKVIDELYGLQNIAYRAHAVHLKTSFLIALAGVVSDYVDFWDGNRLVVSKELRLKLAKFPLTDPHVKDLSSSAGKAITLLESLIVEHINSNKRTRRLTKRDWIPPVEEDAPAYAAAETEQDDE